MASRRRRDSSRFVSGDPQIRSSVSALPRDVAAASSSFLHGPHRAIVFTPPAPFKRLPARRGVVYAPPPVRTPTRKSGGPWRFWGSLSVRVPERVKFCVQRKERREVLFARRVAGRRGTAPGPYRRSPKSQWSC